MKKAPVMTDLLGIRLSSTLLVMKRYLVKSFRLKKAKLSFEEWMNLLPIIQNQNPTQNELAKFLGKDKANVSRMVDLWEKRGLVTKQRSPTDSRAIHLKPTSKALSLHSQAMEIVIAADSVFSKGLSNKELDSLLMSLTKIQNAVAEKSRS